MNVNERIRELAEQARKHFPGTETSGEYWVFDEEKFAELIVRECCKIMVEHSHRRAGVVKRNVKLHFGVKE